MRARAGVVLLPILACLACLACSDLGVGTGTVTGVVSVPECTFKDGTATPYPHGDPFDLKPSYFVGEPIDADPVNGPRFPANQMVIRVQPEAQRKEDADILIVWVSDSAAVARCIRGDTSGGAPEWDPLLCDRSGAAADGPGRMLVGMTGEKIRAFLAFNHTCPQAFVSADALGACTEGCPDVSLCPGRDSWITFSRFGNIPQAGVAIPAGFRVNDKDVIEASDFHLELCDGATVRAKLDYTLPIPQPNIVASLNGNFRFELVQSE